MVTIHKYALQLEDPDVTVQMPGGAVVRHVGNQRGRLCVWAEVDTSRPMHDRKFRVVHTGQSLECEDGVHLNYKGTAALLNGMLVLHVYEIDDVPF